MLGAEFLKIVNLGCVRQLYQMGANQFKLPRSVTASLICLVQTWIT
jgi:hypothetical protein